jgi:hypothetical protein
MAELLKVPHEATLHPSHRGADITLLIVERQELALYGLLKPA